MASLQRERLDPGIEVLRLDRPQARNALDSAALAELERALAALAADDALRVLVLSTTSERALCAGADVAEALDRDGALARMEAFTRVYAAVEAFPAPTVCVCVGNVVGAGAELAAGCDLRVGGDNLKLAWAGARLGVPVGPARLTPLVGLATAKDLVLTGRTLGMQEARALHPYSDPIEVMWQVMLCESSGQPGLVASSYYGLFQYQQTTWAGEWNPYRDSSILDPRAQIFATAKAWQDGNQHWWGCYQ